MSRGCSHCGQNGHRWQTCPNGESKLSGVRLGWFRRSLSTGHLRRGLLAEKSDYGDGYLSDDLDSGRRQREVVGDRCAILKKFSVSMMTTELASYGRRPHFIQETRKEMRSNLFDIEEDEENFDGNSIPIFPETEFNYTRDGTSQKDSNKAEDDIKSSIGSTTGSGYYSCMDVELDEKSIGVNEANAANQRTNDSYKKVTWKWIFVISNFIFEILSAIFEQLSAPHKSHYALIGMVTSFAASVICVIEIVCKCRQQNITWGIRGKIYWFYHPSPSHKRFGSFQEIFGLVCAILQLISGVISFTFYRHNSNSPINLSLCSVVFAFGLLFSKFCNDQEKVDID